jgi:hypothetical protein
LRAFIAENAQKAMIVCCRWSRAGMRPAQSGFQGLGVRLAVRFTTGPRIGDSGSISDSGVGVGT